MHTGKVAAMTTERIQPQPSGIDTLAEVQRLQDAGVPEQHAVAMLYAAIRASDAKFDDLRRENAREFAALRTDIDAKFEAIDKRFEALEAKFEAIETKISALETKIEASTSRSTASTPPSESGSLRSTRGSGPSTSRAMASAPPSARRSRRSTSRSRGKGGGGTGCVHVAVDDHSRYAYAEVLPDERGVTTAAFLERAIAFFADLGIRIERVITDNGGNYLSGAFRGTAAAHGAVLRRTRPYRPQTNGKAEAFTEILQNEWAYGHFYTSNAERLEDLPVFLREYNHACPHGGICGAVPASRL